MRLLITRPEPQGERTAAALRERGHEVTLAPLLRIEPRIDADLRGAWAAALMTSANAVRFLRQHARRAAILATPLYTVGKRSAEAAREAGFARVQSADGDARDLVKLVTRSVPAPGPLLYLAGEDRAGDIDGDLVAAGYRVRTAIVYRASNDGVLPEAVAQALRAGAIDGVLHFSRRTAEAFVVAAAGSGLPLNSLKCNHFCLSAQVAEALAATGAARISVAPRPEEAAVIALVDAL